MRKKIWITGLMLLSGTGCSSMNNTESGALGGAAVGGVAGGLLGAVVRAPVAGAVVGGLVGSAVGASAGADQDRRENRDKYYQAAAAAQARNQMSLNDVVQMVQRGNSDTIVINQINATGSIFALTAEEINYLHDQRVSDAVISAMQARRYRYVQQPNVVYVDPGYPPPVAVGVGIGFGRRW